jgi:hypothetical protein
MKRLLHFLFLILLLGHSMQGHATVCFEPPCRAILGAKVNAGKCRMLSKTVVVGVVKEHVPVTKDHPGTFRLENLRFEKGGDPSLKTLSFYEEICGLELQPRPAKGSYRFYMDYDPRDPTRGDRLHYIDYELLK